MSTELEKLTQRYLDGTLSAGEMASLNAALRADESARREFAELLNLDSAMAAAAAGGLKQAIPPRKVIAFPKAARWLTVAACVAFLAGSGWWWQAHRAFATVVNGAGVEELSEGVKLRDQLYMLKAGTVELLTAKGARVVIEAPAEFRFESAQRLHMLNGRLAAEVPPAAKGFTVVTPSGDAVDLGTQFGVDVPASGPAEIHVFKGEVIAKANGAGAGKSLRGGDAVTLQQGTSGSRELRSSAFIQLDELPGLAAGLAAGQRDRAEAALAQLRKDPALIALLDFESGEPQPGVFRIVQGRWPGSRAPEFVDAGDHLKLNAGGGHDWPLLTLAAWVRLDRLGAPFQSLLHTDGWSENNPGQVHWMVTKATTMRLALIGNTLAPGSEEISGYPNSVTPVLPEQGRWVHLAAVYDSVNHTARLYLNGRLDKESHLAIAHPARLGAAQIGNWDSQDRKLSGRVDELILLGRAMSDDEVRALFEAGNPYR